MPHDPDQIEQVLINLLKNAAEASSPGGTIRLRVQPLPGPTPGRRRGHGAGPAADGLAGGVQIQVEDHGSGIAAETLKTLFEPFTTTKPGGSGLGLYISHDIVKRHGGRLAVSSEPGRGTTFTVELPLENHGGTS
ncbi:MAG TPA: ATP-binding protein [Acidobacteriota bacterium]|nr:ATP-binding protein [Acidobacteriota bacterium]